MERQEVLLCSQCEKEIEGSNFYYIFRFSVVTDKEEYEIGIKKLLPELASFLMAKGSHLSASEIIFLRPDVVMEFLGQRYSDEKILLWYLKEYMICYECYEEYKFQVPLI